MASPLSLQQIRRARMASQLLDAPKERTALDVARWCGALQAQDAASGHWSLGVRCVGATEVDVIDAFERGDVVRTWPMRGTIHIVPGPDASWMLALMAHRALAGAARRRQELNLEAGDGDRAAAILEEALQGRGCLTRAQCLAALQEAGMDVSGQRSYFLLSYSAHIGVTAIGPQRGSDQTFVLLRDWTTSQVELPREDALAELLHRFVRSHGPVPLRDFVGWTGLTVTDAKAAAAANDGRVTVVPTVAGDMLVATDLAERLDVGPIGPQPVVTLSGFDEFILGYKDRTAQIPDGAFERIVPGNNGMFRATVIADGQAIATWKRTPRKRAMTIDVEPFTPLSSTSERRAVRAFDRYAEFLDCDVEVRIASA